MRWFGSGYVKFKHFCYREATRQMVPSVKCTAALVATTAATMATSTFRDRQDRINLQYTINLLLTMARGVGASTTSIENIDIKNEKKV